MVDGSASSGQTRQDINVCWNSTKQTNEYFAKLRHKPQRRFGSAASSFIVAQPISTFGLIYCIMTAVPRIITNKTILTGYVLVYKKKIEVIE
jgi:hypothetical protein